MRWWYEYLRPWIQRGYQPAAKPAPAMDWVGAEEPVALLAFCPTYAGATNQASQAETILEIATQLADAALPSRALLIGMQCRPEERQQALQRLDELRRMVTGAGVDCRGFVMPCFGKVRSVNAALAAAARWHAEGLLQVDDDIRLEPGCLAALYRSWKAGGSRAAVGAAKAGHATRHRASQVLLWLKRVTRPASNYPHACCLLLSPGLLGQIPLRYVSDDGYICFQLLRPEFGDPFELLRIEPRALCHHTVGGPAGRSWLRIRRLLLNHHVLLSDAREPVSRFYIEHVLFPGFWPVGSGEGFHPLRWMLQALYFCWFLSVGMELALRGWCGCPLDEIRWAGFENRERPQAPAAHTAPAVRP
ncbi:MAG: hypothetical protein JNK87_10225 [Bryobacterales bacterium]|nr:hypothetical protein [Bryobacterales bacterium]